MSKAGRVAGPQDGHDHDPEGGHGHDGPNQGGHAHAHAHGVSQQSDKRYLTGALALILAFMAAEVVVGLASRSLALVADAGHMLTDAFSLLLALAALRLAAKPAAGRWTFGFKRAEILSAQANGITLLVLVVLFTYESVRRLIDPPRVSGGPVIATALAGIAVNAAAVWLVGRANRTSLNIEGAFKHLLSDAWAFAATAVAGLIVLTTGFERADAVASLVVAGLMAAAGYALVRDSWQIFLEGAPEGLDPAAIGARLVAEPHIAQVHDLHVWTITSGFPALSAHVLVEPGRDCHGVRVALQELLHDEYGIDHTTLQVDHAPETLLTIGSGPPPESGPGSGARGHDLHDPGFKGPAFKGPGLKEHSPDERGSRERDPQERAHSEHGTEEDGASSGPELPQCAHPEDAEEGSSA